MLPISIEKVPLAIVDPCVERLDMAKDQVLWFHRRSKGDTCKWVHRPLVALPKEENIIVVVPKCVKHLYVVVPGQLEKLVLPVHDAIYSNALA